MIGYHILEVCFCYIDKAFEDQELLGGDGVVVEIDECKIGKRKYNTGGIVDGVWIIQMIEINVGIDTNKRERRGGR